MADEPARDETATIGLSAVWHFGRADRNRVHLPARRKRRVLRALRTSPHIGPRPDRSTRADEFGRSSNWTQDEITSTARTETGRRTVEFRSAGRPSQRVLH